MTTTDTLGATQNVSTASELTRAISNASIKTIIVRQSISDLASFMLEEKAIKGSSPGIALSFVDTGDGIVVGKNASIESIRINTRRDRRAILNRTDIPSLGVLSIKNVETIGQIQILGKDALTEADIQLDRIFIIEADSYDRPERPASGTGPNGANVDIIQGALTIFNTQPDDASLFKVRARRISAGSLDRPVRGSGVLISGSGGNIYTTPGIPTGGRVEISILETGDVYSHSQIPEGTPGLISGGVFVAFAEAERVRTGKTVTNGNNGLGIDNWGNTKSWQSGKVVTYGNSGIGVVHFGIITELAVESVETFGSGARAFNALTGTTGSVSFGSLRTNGNGASAILVRSPVEEVLVTGDITTFGASAESLASGVLTLQYSIGIWIEDGSVGSVTVRGGIRTHGDGSQGILATRSTIESLEVKNGIASSGMDTDTVLLDESTVPLVDLNVSSTDGAGLVVDGATIPALTDFHASGADADFYVKTNSTVHTEATTIEELETGFRNSFSVSGPGSLNLVL